MSLGAPWLAWMVDWTKIQAMRNLGVADRSLAFERDIAMLGLIHRSFLGCGPRHFASMFQLAPPSTSQKHCLHLQSHRGSCHLQKLVRSTLGLTDFYNLLPGRVHELQCLLKIQSSEQGRRLAAHLLTSRLSV